MSAPAMGHLVRVMKEGQSVAVGDIVLRIEEVRGPNWIKVSVEAPLSAPIAFERSNTREDAARVTDGTSS